MGKGPRQRRNSLPKRGRTINGVPTVEHLKDLGMALPELLEIADPLLEQEAKQ